EGSDIKQSSNARVAMLRLAELNLGVGESKKAIDTLERLILVFPHHKSVLLLLAKGYQADNLPGKSISIWQKLIRGVNPGTEIWFEAKYNLTKALLDDGQISEAGKLYEQTLRLSPSMPEPWQQAFADLEPNFKNL
ncbi:MAG: tetratricopeptide (TPR) repeat protein, partial [Mariniblastus sp.]